MKAMNFQDDILSIPFDVFGDHYILVIDLTSMRDTSENCLYPELTVQQLRLELNFSFPLDHVDELIVLGEQTYSVAVHKLSSNIFFWRLTWT